MPPSAQCAHRAPASLYVFPHAHGSDEGLRGFCITTSDVTTRRGASHPKSPPQRPYPRPSPCCCKLHVVPCIRVVSGDECSGCGRDPVGTTKRRGAEGGLRGSAVSDSPVRPPAVILATRIYRPSTLRTSDGASDRDHATMLPRQKRLSHTDSVGITCTGMAAPCTQQIQIQMSTASCGRRLGERNDDQRKEQDLEQQMR